MTTWITRIFITLGTFVLAGLSVYAQDNEIISSETVGRLQSVQHIDYADLDADIDIGWFAANDSATEFIVFDNDYHIYHLSETGDILDILTYVEDEDQIFSVIDGTYVFDEFQVVYTVDGEFWINDTRLENIEGVPVALGRDENALYVEAQVDNELVVYQLDDALQVQGEFTIPSDTPEPVMRVGRIHIPLIVQSGFDGYTRIFNFDHVVGEFVADEPPTVFGQINYDVTHFAWIDPESTHLNLFNIESGESHVVSDLNNLYAQDYLIALDGSLVMGINVDFTPNVIVWDTETGQRYDLGEYRSCERIPDEVRISIDGTTLVIGCDTGLDLWRITNDGE